MLSLFRFGTTLTSTINFMTRGFDDRSLTFYETKLCDHDKDNCDNNVKHISLLILKISFLTLFGCRVKITPN